MHLCARADPRVSFKVINLSMCIFSNMLHLIRKISLFTNERVIVK